MSDLVIHKFRKSMVIDDTECPYWDQVLLNDANQTKPLLFLIPMPYFIATREHADTVTQCTGDKCSLFPYKSTSPVAREHQMADDTLEGHMTTSASESCDMSQERAQDGRKDKVVMAIRRYLDKELY